MKRFPAPVPAFLFTFLILLSGVNPPPAESQSNVADHPRVQEALRLLETWMQAQRDYGEIPGASLAVVHDQELIYAKGFGYAHLEDKVPATLSTMYSICSISKLFTSISLMRLRDQGLVTLRDPVGEHLEWFDLHQQFPEMGPVTVEGILTHSSGLPREANAPYWSGPEYPFPPHDVIVEGLSNQEMLYPARSHYQYSNLGLTMAGEIVAAKSGMSWNDYVQQHILDPLGMENTATEHLDEFRGDRLATGYSAKRRDGTRVPIPPYQVRGIGPAAGMLSSVEDLAKFASWQFRVLEGDDGGILDRNTLREMQRVHFMEPDASSTYGLGFSVWRDNDKTFVGHGGSCPGYLSHLLIRPQDKIATTFMTNGQGLSSRSFTQTAFSIMAPAIRAAVKDPDGGDPPEDELERFTGLYSRPLGSESAVLTWEGQLVVLGLPSSNPVSGMTKLKHIEGNSFRRVRSDGELGEEYLFEEGPDGTMTYWVHNNPRIRTSRLSR